MVKALTEQLNSRYCN